MEELTDEPYYVNMENIGYGEEEANKTLQVDMQGIIVGSKDKPYYVNMENIEYGGDGDDDQSNVEANKTLQIHVQESEREISSNNISGDYMDGCSNENEQSMKSIESGTSDFSGSLVGYTRENLEDIYELYCVHARQVGFSTRKSTGRKNITGKISVKNFCCSCEGVAKQKNKEPGNGNDKEGKSTRRRMTTRTNCGAMLRVKVHSDGLCEVTEHKTEHNHELTMKEWSHRHRSHRSITSEKGAVIEQMIAVGIGSVDSFRLMSKEAGGESVVGHTLRDHHNFVNALKMKAIEAGDAQTLIDILCQQGVEDEHFFYRFKLDEEGRLSNIFWRDSMMGEDYQIFGDVVVFDTTYRTNKYNLICAPFIGLNHHKKNVMFGCAFLSDETIETFKWLFEVFQKSMKMKEPVTVFTDQDLAITNALATVFPNSRHRLCIWHLYQNTVSRFGKLKGNKLFNCAFEKCMTGCNDEEDFEQCWNSMITTYGLDNNYWFQRLYDLREKWCTGLSKEYFSAGILSSQRSESINNAIGFKANNFTNLTAFYEIFRNTVQRWRSTEQGDEFNCSRSVPSSSLPLTGMLKHASEVYTISIFYIFEEKFRKCHSTTVDVVGDEMGVIVYDVCNHDDKNTHRVDFYGENKFVKFTCKRFEEWGLLCCHCLRVLDRHSMRQIPTCYIAPRWTKFAKKELWDKLGSSSVQVEYNPWRHDMARKYYNLVMKSLGNDEAQRVLEDGYETLSRDIQALTNESRDLIEGVELTSSYINVGDPAQPTTKGRKKRKKRGMEKNKRKSKKKTPQSN